MHSTRDFFGNAFSGQIVDMFVQPRMLTRISLTGRAYTMIYYTACNEDALNTFNVTLHTSYLSIHHHVPN